MHRRDGCVDTGGQQVGVVVVDVDGDVDGAVATSEVEMEPGPALGRARGEKQSARVDSDERWCWLNGREGLLRGR